MNKEQTKEQLNKRIAELEIQLKERVEYGERVRKEFAKAFSWFQKRGMYDNQTEATIPTWEQIFVEVGKLLASKNFYDFEGNVSELECKVEGLEKKINPPN